MAGSNRRAVIDGSGLRRRRITSGVEYFYGKFDGLRRVDLGSQSSPGTDATITFWINRNTISGGAVLFFGRMQLSLSSAAGSFVWYPDFFGSNQNLALPTDMVAGQWHHVAIVQDGTTALAYLDGVAGTLDASTPPLNTSADNSRFGGTSSSFLDAGMRDLRIYDVALSAGDIESVRLNAAISDSPVYHLPFDDGAGTTVTADAGSNGTVVGSSTGDFWASATFPA